MNRFTKRLIAVAILATAFGPSVYSFASWEGRSAASGGVYAGSLQASLFVPGGTFAGDEWTFLWNGTCDSGNLAPGAVCFVHDIEIRNSGTLTLTYSSVEYVDPPSLNDCFDIALEGIVDNDGGTPRLMPPGDTEKFSMTLTVPLFAPNSCQGQSGKAGVTIHAVLANDPHGSND